MNLTVYRFLISVLMLSESVLIYINKKLLYLCSIIVFTIIFKCALKYYNSKLQIFLLCSKVYIY